MVFTIFKLLPYDIRLQVWAIACRSARMSVMSPELSATLRKKGNSLPVHRMIQQPGCSCIAMACKEAFYEWERATVLFSEGSSVRLYTSRTIFLFSDLAGVGKGRLDRYLANPDVMSSIQHTAFLVTPGVSLLDILSSLSILPLLKTVSIVLPGCDTKGAENGKSPEAKTAARYLTMLADRLSLEVNHDTANTIGLFLESAPPDPRVEAFYTGLDAPQINVIFPQCDEDRQLAKMDDRSSMGFSLFEYK
ncbi:uncharacterized protein FIESC28_08160 [Fusarium coffeatum]|uniref:2EXR domain-containing protein n=1 Tax=Fusarium coffeatum TaxID=231269 RepID=A0A366R8L0_9HYPO|nr:uncharacterized protein FIESC28_08160 [Fusarium coffeatum]RBR13483.1 hypothetical protein FIESC28_08160 [Fusarium coffeatum]